jgi:RNA polymerase sigma-70 factor (ECF subfamily)
MESPMAARYAMKIETLSDDELLRLMLAGDEAAFAQVYRRHHARVFRFALQMSGERAVAEDVTQETFLTLVRDGARFCSSQGALTSFLYGIARNHLKRHFARESRYTPLDAEAEDENAKFSTDDFKATNDPLDALTRDAEIDKLRRAILSLPEHYREAIVLCELHEMNYEAAARALECPIGTIRSRLSRARALLVERLREDAKQGNERCAAKSLN